MLRYFILIGLSLFLGPFFATAKEKDTSTVAKIILIGDAGELTPDLHHTVVEAVEKLELMDSNTTVIFLGDNLYRHGLPSEQVARYAEARAVLDSQANIADHGAGRVYFIPGNHDWMNGLPQGYNAVLRQQQYLNSLNKKNLRFIPADGCPGPEEIDLGNDVVLVVMDTQWWLHKQAKPGIESDCDNKTREEVLSELQDIVTRNYKKLLIFAAHHPFKSNGIHGGYYTIKQHIFPFTDIQKNLYIPLPILGSIYPISRSVFGTVEDLRYPDYANMVNQIDAILKTHPNVIHVAGHEHAMEWIVDSNSNYIVSGSGCKTNRVSKSRKSKFVAASIGWARLDIHDDKTVDCSFIAASKDSLGKVLYHDRVLDYSKLPPRPQADTSSPLVVYHDTALVPASHRYDHPGRVQKFLDGTNYRKEWSEPVDLRVFHVSTTLGGFKITGAGGGFQTKTLHIKDSAGVKYNLRTIDKDPRKVLPANMRETFARDVVQDMISAADPYAPMVVYPLAVAAGVTASAPSFYYVPDDPALGFYRPLFANKVCLLELNDPTLDGTKSKSSDKVISKIISDDDHFVDQKLVLQARLLDMLIGDWDRHLGQWHWGVGDTGKGKLYYPIPRDRDQAFFNSDGLIMKLASRRTLPWMSGFKKHYHRFRWLNHSPRDFDRLFLNDLTKADWEVGIRQFQASITDTVIDHAIRQMPAPIQAISGQMIAAKLKNRRDDIYRYGMGYYYFLNHEVQILGSNKPEQFNVTQSDSGILVQVHAHKTGKDTSLLMYSRLFDPKVTKEIRLFGFNGNDRFDVDAGVHTRMRIRMIGGVGNDTFNVAGKAHSYIYDVSTEPNMVLAHRHTDNEFNKDPIVNDFKVQDYAYSFMRVPTIAAGFNPDDGILAGIGIWRRTYAWRKTPFESDNRLNALFAFARKAYEIKYKGSFIHVLKDLDVLIDADMKRPDLRNFFGYGNETHKDNELTYYRARFNSINADLMLQKRLFGIVRAALGPSYYYYSNHAVTNDNKVLENPQQLGLDSVSIYTHKQYLGLKVFTDINNLNSELFPTRGINWHTEFNAQGGISGDAKPYTELHSDMDVYASLSEPAKLVAVLRFGGGHIFSKDFEFFQSEAIGQNNYLRGFRKDRFSGRSMAYNSIELRGKLFDVKGYILPGAFGLVGFNDVARVWADGEQSNKWHDSYGGGFYYIPFNMFLVSATLGFSPEETLINFTVGTKLNLTF